LRHQPGDGKATSLPVFLKAPPPEHTTGSHRRWVALGAEYGFDVAGAGFAHELGAHATLLASRSIGVRLHLAGVLPHATTASGVELMLEGARGALGVAASHPIAGRTSLAGELGGAVEVISYHTGALADPSLMATPGGLDKQPIVYAHAGVRFAF